MTTHHLASVRELVSQAGDVPSRIRGRERVAQSQVRIDLPTDAALRRCLTELSSSDERLAAKPHNYDWTVVWKETLAGVEGGTVEFGVAWYDEEFFAAKKDTYLSPDHISMFAEMDAGICDVTVRHFARAA